MRVVLSKRQLDKLLLFGFSINIRLVNNLYMVLYTYRSYYTSPTTEHDMLSEISLKTIPMRASNRVKAIYLTNGKGDISTRAENTMDVMLGNIIYKRIGVLIGKKIYWLNTGFFANLSELNSKFAVLGVALKDNGSWANTTKDKKVKDADFNKEVIHLDVSDPSMLPVTSQYCKKSVRYEGFSVKSVCYFDATEINKEAYLSNPNKTKGSVITKLIKDAINKDLRANRNLFINTEGNYGDEDGCSRIGISFTVDTEIGEITINIDGEPNHTDTIDNPDGGYTDKHVVTPKGFLSMVVPLHRTGEHREILAQEVSGLDALNDFIRKTFVGCAVYLENDKWRSSVGEYMSCDIKL